MTDRTEADWDAWEQDYARQADWNRTGDWGPPSLPADCPRTVRVPGDAAHRFSRTVRWARVALGRKG